MGNGSFCLRINYLGKFDKIVLLKVLYEIVFWLCLLLVIHYA